MTRGRHWIELVVAGLLITIFLGGYGVTAMPGNTRLPNSTNRIVVGDDINYPPYSYVDADGNPQGFNIALAKAVGEAMGLTVEVRLDEWSRTREALEAGEIDAISGMFYSEERSQTYAFTTRHSVTSGDIFTRTATMLGSLEDLRGKTVVVQKGDIVAEYLAGAELEIQLVEVFTVNEALSLVADGTYDYAGLMKLPGIYAMEEQGFSQLRSQGLQLIPNDYSMAVRRDNEDLLLLLNGGLKIVQATGEYQAIYDEWLGVYEERDFRKNLVRYHRFLLVAGGMVVVLLGMSLFLRYLVHKRTAALRGANEELQLKQLELQSLNMEMEASMEELTAMEQELRDQLYRIRESERRLAESEQKNRAIVQALPDIIFTFDPKGQFIDCQASDHTHLQMPTQSLVGKYIEDVLPLELAESGLSSIRKSLESGKLERFEFEIPLRGERRIFEMRIVPLESTTVIGITRDITREKRYQEEIEYLSYRDQLTGLYNRRFFEEELKRLDTGRTLPLCLIMADVNGLKLINDSFGHAKGDALLQKVAEVLTRVCRPDEIIARIGGDEFVLLVPGMTGAQAEKLVERIQKLAAAETIGSMELSISFGWEVKTSSEEDMQEIFNRAEDYMYQKKLFEGPSMRSKTINAIIRTLHEKNEREEAHSKRVSQLSMVLAQVLGFSQRDVEQIRTMGLLHDIGKIAINEEILNKPGRLTEEEYEEIKRHPEIGFRILSSVNDMVDMAEYVLCHHERWDGNGYPRGLAGEATPIQARIIAITDAYDAMTSDRSYRHTLTPEAAVKELHRCAGTQFDPHLVAIFVEKVIEADAENTVDNLET